MIPPSSRTYGPGSGRRRSISGRASSSSRRRIPPSRRTSPSTRSRVRRRRWHDRPFRRTHSIEELGEQCLTLDPSLRGVVDPAVPLTEYAWRFRYPGEPEEPTRGEAESALALARALFEGVLTRLPEKVDPGR